MLNYPSGCIMPPTPMLVLLVAVEAVDFDRVPGAREKLSVADPVTKLVFKFIRFC